MMKAFNLSKGKTENPDLFKAYEKAGFDRGMKFYSLQNKNETHGIIMADRSETGLNMSDLTNSLKVFITNPEGIRPEILKLFLKEASGGLEDQPRIPVLMYPDTAAEPLGFPPDKNYTLWVINMEASDTYFKYLKTLLKIIHH